MLRSMSSIRRLASQWPRVAVGLLGAAVGLLGLSTLPACTYGPSPDDDDDGCQTDQQCVDRQGPGWYCDRPDSGIGSGGCSRLPDGGR